MRSDSWKKYGFWVFLATILLLLAALVFLVPNNAAFRLEARHVLANTLIALYNGLVSVFLHCVLTLLPIAFGIEMRLSVIPSLQKLLYPSKLSELEWLVQALMLSFVIGVLWVLLVPIVLKNPYVASTFIYMDLPIHFEIAPFEWGGAAAALFLVCYLGSWWTQKIGEHINLW